MKAKGVAILLALGVHTLAFAEPMVTAAAHLAPRAVDPGLVGYISANGGYSDGRTCDYPQTVSTSGGFVQCCPTTGACPFYTACSSNTLIAASGTVPCDINAALTCNTAIVLPTAGAANPGSYLACWQKTLGSSPFTFVQDTQGASRSATATGSSRSSTASGSATITSLGTQGSSAAGGSVSATATATATSRNVAATENIGLSGGVIGFLALLAQAIF